MSDRWCVYVDIEGFSSLYEKDGRDSSLRGLRAMMEAIFRIGKHCYPESPERLFAHQTGDGFAIVSEFGSQSLDNPTAITIAIMRHVASAGFFCKASLGEGDHADITGLYPQEVRDAIESGGHVRMGRGIMTLFSTMGSAFINAHHVHNLSPSGPLFTMSARHRERVPSGIDHKFVKNDLMCVDWINAKLRLVGELQEKAKLDAPSEERLTTIIADYTHKHMLPGPWLEGLQLFQSEGTSQDRAE